MFEWLTNNATALKGVGTLLGGVGTMYGMYKQGKVSDQINKLNLSMYNNEVKRQDDRDKSLKLAFDNSTYAKGV